MSGKLTYNKRCYLCKFVNKKYNINVIDIERTKYTEYKYELNIINLYLKYNRYINIRVYNNNIINATLYTHFSNFWLYKNDGTEINLDYIFNYKPSLIKYLPTLLYFMKLDNILNAYNYIIKNHDFLDTTNYVEKLPLAYTFLLSNKIRIFPRDIAKLITQKILFFKIEKRKRKKKMNRVKEKKIEEFWNSKTGGINSYMRRLVIRKAEKFGVRFDTVDTIYYASWAGPETFSIHLNIDLICENKKIYIEIEEICEDYVNNPTVMASRLEDIMEFSSNGCITIGEGCSYELGRLNWYKTEMQSQLMQFSKPYELRTFLTDVPTMTKICETAYTVYSQFYLNYFSSLPKAYTFLLCNSFMRQFPRDIAKIIAYKILFFVFFVFS